MPRQPGDGNPNIAEVGKATRFGQPDGADPAQAGAQKSQHSVRHAIRVAGGKRFVDPSDPKVDLATLSELYGYRKGEPISPFQFIAMRKISAAMNGNLAAMQQVEEAIDGKATQTVQATMTYEQLLDQAYKDDDTSAET